MQLDTGANNRAGKSVPESGKGNLTRLHPPCASFTAAKGGRVRVWREEAPRVHQEGGGEEQRRRGEAEEGGGAGQ